MNNQREDITGQKFGRLTAIKKLRKRLRERCPTWLFLCKCGNYVEYPYDNVVYSVHKGRQSCGCLRKKFYASNKVFLGVTNIKGTCVERIVSKNLSKRNTSGTKGVCWDEARKQWISRIMFRGKNYNLGRFSSKKKAIKARQDAEKELHGPFLEWYEKKYKKAKMP